MQWLLSHMASKHYDLNHKYFNIGDKSLANVLEIKALRVQ